MTVLETLAQFEWALMLLIVLGLAVWELVRLRREQARDRNRKD
jgi:hypothetical protein